MNNPNPDSSQPRRGDGVRQTSQGDNSAAQTPKDVVPGQAAARDVTERKIASKNRAEREEALIDESSDLSFPASDPPAVGVVERIEPLN